MSMSNAMVPNNHYPTSIAAQADSVLTGWEKFWWAIMCVFTGAYFRKVFIKKAMLEALIAHQAVNNGGSL